MSTISTKPGDAADSELFVRAFARGLRVIQAMGVGGPRHSIAELSERTQLPRSVVRRLLLTLVEERFVKADERDFWLTPRVLTLGLGYLYTLPFWRTAQPVLDALRQETNQSCSMAVLDGEEIVYVVRTQTRRVLSRNLSVGARIAAHAVSVGRVLLGGLSDGDLADYLETATFKQYTPKTIIDRTQLRKEIVKTRAQGYAWADSELDEGICGMSVPVRDNAGGVVAAISISIFEGSIPEKETKARFLAPLQAAAAKIRGALI